MWELIMRQYHNPNIDHAVHVRQMFLSDTICDHEIIKPMQFMIIGDCDGCTIVDDEMFHD